MDGANVAADGYAVGADEEVGTDNDSQRGFNCRPDDPNAIVFCPAKFNFFVFGGITTGKRIQQNKTAVLTLRLCVWDVVNN